MSVRITLMTGIVYANGGRSDIVDLRDYFYVPRPSPLPVAHMSWDGLLAEDTLSRLIRSQQDNTCVGHALAAMIDIQSLLRGDPAPDRVSAAMLYQMARFYDLPDRDANPGVRSLRSAIKGFYHHGVCPEPLWRDDDLISAWPSAEQAQRSANCTLGTYSRLQPILHHYHCAIVEAGAVLVTAEIHKGWDSPDAGGLIRPDAVHGNGNLHAFVIVGYNPDGFLVLNSWGPDWGGVPAPGGRGLARGLAIWTYADWARSIADGWVLRLGVPGQEAFAVSAGEQGLNRSQSAEARRTVPYRLLRGHFLNLDAGRWQDTGPYPTPRAAAEETVARIKENLRDERCNGLVVALPGVFEGETRSFAKALRLKNAFAAKGLDFLTCLWSANVAAEMQAVLNDIFARCRDRAGTSAETLDALFEQTAQGAGRAFWRDIQRHAYCAAMPCDPDGALWFDDPACHDRRGELGRAILDLARACAERGKPLHLLANGSGALVVDALLMRGRAETGSKDPRDWLPGLGNLVLTFPALPMDQARRRLLGLVEAMTQDRPGSARIFVPSAGLEGRLTTSGYGRSILQLVSRSFLDRPKPMLGSASQALGPFFETFDPRRPYRLDQQELEEDAVLEAKVIDAIAAADAGGARFPLKTQTSIPQEHVMDTAYHPRISLKELQNRIRENTLSPDEMERYLMIDETASGPFSPVWIVNPETVELPAAGTRSALALNSANAAARWLRRSQYDARIGGGYDGLRIAAEGDSWFQYPLRLFDVIDYVAEPYAVFDTSAAGDLLENMAAKREYIGALRHSRADILLLSAGGNDVCAGGDLARHLERYDPNLKPADYLKRSYQAVLDNAIASYERICRDVNRHFPHVTIVVHGYDYVIPKNGRWLGKPMTRCSIIDQGLQRAIAAEMIDQFNRALRRMAQGLGHVAYVDCRKAVGEGEWFDELHPTDAGFARVASRILTRIRDIAGQPAVRPRTDSTGFRTTDVPAESGRRAYSLHIGLNAFDPRHYAGSSGELLGCENDARAMRDLARTEGYETRTLLTAEATREAMIAELHRAARDLRGGDQFLFTVAGHGSRITDLNGDEAEMRNGDMDSTMCLFDSQLIDDELWQILARFEAGVRIVMIADTCHSGTLARKGVPPLILSAPGDLIVPQRPRCLPRSLAARVEEQNYDFYKALTENLPHVNRATLASPIRSPIRASVIQFSACQDDQEAMDGAENGAFTSALLRVWDNGGFSGSHTRLARMVAEELAGTTQTPGLFKPEPVDDAFLRQRPFSVLRGTSDGGTEADAGPATVWRPAASAGADADDADPLKMADDGEDAVAEQPRPFGGRSTASAVPGSVVRKFRDFMAPVGLVHFDAAEFLALGSLHSGNGPARSLNAAPPEALWPNIIPTARILDELRSRLDVPIRIASAYRTPAYNTAIKGKPKSWHLQFRACDVTADGVPAARVADALNDMRDEGLFRGGIGRYPGFTHVDTRGANHDWPEPGRSGPAGRAGDQALARLRQIADSIPMGRDRPRGGDVPGGLDQRLAQASAVMNGAEVMVLTNGLSAERRRAVLYSTQFAQRAADAAADRIADRTAWWTTYNAALAATGWTITGSVAREATTRDLEATVDAMALDLMASVVGLGKLRAIRAVLDGLRGLAGDDQRLVLLDRETARQGGGAIQIGEAELDQGRLAVTTAAIQFSSSDARQHVLFAKWGKSAQDLWLAAERMVLNEEFYVSTAQAIVEERLGDAAARIRAFDLADTGHVAASSQAAF